MSLEDKIKKEEKEDNVLNYPGKGDRRKGDRRKNERRGGYNPLKDYISDKVPPKERYDPGKYEIPSEKPYKK